MEIFHRYLLYRFEDLRNAALNNKGNLLELSVEAIRARATVGEISNTLEKVYGRFEAKPRISKNIYSDNFEEKNKLDDLKYIPYENLIRITRSRTFIERN